MVNKGTDEMVSHLNAAHKTPGMCHREHRSQRGFAGLPAPRAMAVSERSVSFCRQIHSKPCLSVWCLAPWIGQM